YINHGATNQAQLNAAFADQTNGIVRVLPGTYDYYTEWVWFDNPTNGTYRLPAPDNFASIIFVADKGPSYNGIVRLARSADGHQAEMAAPFRGFMRDPTGNPVVALRKTMNISISLEASGELAPGGQLLPQSVSRSDAANRPRRPWRKCRCVLGQRSRGHALADYPESGQSELACRLRLRHHQPDDLARQHGRLLLPPGRAVTSSP
ncbi:MAG: hypothetical protein DME25_15520, partial [Verrucomicrobia bacterium]